MGRGHSFCFASETGSHCADPGAEAHRADPAGLELVLILLPFFPECWGYSMGCPRFKTLEKNVEHLGGDRSNSGEPVVKRLGWSYTENLVSIHFN